MSWRHRDILEAELHEPKGFTTANNGDSVWRNEQNLLEWTDREVLPAALNFVDASIAPPTTANGDIYVLSLGASIHANWGTVALKDWVRYDGAVWKVITPSKSILCYDKTLDVLMAFSGSLWATVGTNTNISNEDLTFDANHYADLVTYDWEVKKGSDTYFKIPSNGKMRMTSPNASVNDYILTIDQRLGGYGLAVLQGTNDAGLNVAGSNNSIMHTYNHNGLDRVNFGSDSNTGNYMVNVINGGVDFGGGRMVNMISQSTGGSFAGITLGYKAGALPMGVLTGYTRGIEMYLSASVIHTFNVDGTTIFKGTAVVGTEKISLQDDTLIKGSDTSASTTGFKVTNSANTSLLEVKNNGVINAANLPTSSAGLSSGDIWNNSGVLNIV
jgi:hypothetical protein